MAIATVPAEPGAEPLQGRHLPGLLRARFAQRFAETLQLADRLDRGDASGPALPLVHGAAGKRPA
jgi:hypothetical protein